MYWLSDSYSSKIKYILSQKTHIFQTLLSTRTSSLITPGSGKIDFKLDLSGMKLGQNSLMFLTQFSQKVSLLLNSNFRNF